MKMMKGMKMLPAVVLFSGLVLAPAFANGAKNASRPAGGTAPDNAGSAPYTITIAGSTSVNPLMELLIEDYRKVRSTVGFNVSATGSGDGIKAVPAGTAEIGMSSRDLSPAEMGTGITIHRIALDGIAVIVNPANPVSGLSIEQIRAVYTGQITDWNQLGAGKSGRISVVSREPGSGTRGAFEEIVKFQDALVKGATEFDGTGAIKAEISRNADAIGYISLGSLDNTVKALSVGGAEATTANVVNGSYPIARPFLLLTRKGQTPHPETQAFLDWILSDSGQAIVKKSWISVK